MRPLGFAVVLGSVRGLQGALLPRRQASVFGPQREELGSLELPLGIAVDPNNRYRLHARQRDALFEALIAA